MTIDEVEPYKAKEINEPYIMMGADVPNSPKRRYTSRSELLNATLPTDDEDVEENDNKDEVFETAPPVAKQISSESSSESSEAEEEKNVENNSEDILLNLEEKNDVVISDKTEEKETTVSSKSSENEENAKEIEELPEVVEESKEEAEPEETAEDVAFKLMTRKPDKNDSILLEASLDVTKENETDSKPVQDEIMEEPKTEKIETEPESEDQSNHEIGVLEESHVKPSSSSATSSEAEQTELNIDDVEIQPDSNEFDTKLKASEPIINEEINVREEVIETKEPNDIIEETKDIVEDTSITNKELHSQPESQVADQSLGSLIQAKAQSQDEMSDQEVDETRIEVNAETDTISEVEETPALAHEIAKENLYSNIVEENDTPQIENFPEPPNLDDQNINIEVNDDEKQKESEDIEEPEDVNKNQSMNETVSTLSSSFQRRSSVSSTSNSSDSSAASFTSSNQTEDKTLADKTEVEPEDKNVSVKEEIAKLEDRSVANEETKPEEKPEEKTEEIEDASTSLVDTTLSPDTTLPTSESLSNHEAITEDIKNKTEEDIVTSLVEDALTRSESQLNENQQVKAEANIEDIVSQKKPEEDVKEEKADIIEDEKSKISLKDKIKFFKSEIFRAEQKPAPEKIEPPRISRQVSLSQVFIIS